MEKTTLEWLLCEIAEELRRIACDPRLNWQIMSTTTRREVQQPKQGSVLRPMRVETC